jgi:hypothetical protein
MIRALSACAGLLFSIGATVAAAQAPTPPAEPATPAPVQLGPVAVRPSLVLRDVGYDSNVFNRSDGEQGDYTATLGARIDLAVKGSRAQATYATSYEYLHFQTFQSERGSNAGTDGRLDLLLGRLRPYVTAGISRSHDRPNSEIDERALRVQTSVGAGAGFAAFSRTSLNAGYRRQAIEYADSERFRGVALSDQLNGTSDAITVGADIALTPLTTVSLHGERSRDRFDLASYRDSDSYRAGITANFHPLALISGRATLGIRAFRPIGDQLQGFTGLTAAVAVAYAFQERTRVGLTFDRDLRYSFAENTPYYISTGGRATVTQRLVGQVEGQVMGALEQFAYEPRRDAIGPFHQRDRVRTIGTGLGYRLNDGTRLGVNFDLIARSSAAAEREYSRRRVYATLSYGF